MTDRLTRITTAPAVVAVADVAAIISYHHASKLFSTYGEYGLTARLLPFTVDGSSGPRGSHSPTAVLQMHDMRVYMVWLLRGRTNLRGQSLCVS